MQDIKQKIDQEKKEQKANKTVIIIRNRMNQFIYFYNSFRQIQVNSSK